MRALLNFCKKTKLGNRMSLQQPNWKRKNNKKMPSFVRFNCWVTVATIYHVKCWAAVLLQIARYARDSVWHAWLMCVYPCRFVPASVAATAITILRWPKTHARPHWKPPGPIVEENKENEVSLLHQMAAALAQAQANNAAELIAIN